MPPAIPVSTEGLACVHCGYDLRGLRPGAVCPGCATPAPDRASGSGRASCIRCGYSLAGLPEAGDCPECGTSVEFSRYGVLLRARGGRYLRRLHRGVVLVQMVILLQTALMVFFFLAGIFEGAPELAQIVVGLTMIVFQLLALVGMLGWWWFTARDPMGVERRTASRSRVLVRAMVVVQAAAILLPIAVMGFELAVDDRGTLASFVAVLLACLLMLAAWPVHFFASMAYLRWLAVRLPDEAIVRRAGLVMWLAPLLATVGMLVVIGPLIAVACYWNLLESVRKHLKRILAELAAAGVQRDGGGAEAAATA